ncbi:MAG: TRAP transporter large permease [Pseudomonadota bacterium]
MLIGLFLVFMLLRAPISVAISLATIIAMLAGGYDLMMLPQKMAASTQSIELMAIPFFILAANLMTALGITRDIYEFANALVGALRGGLAQANVVAGIIFSGISGAAVADAAALGSISMEEMPKAGYSRPFSAAVVVAVSTLGPMLPPSIMMVIYAITAEVSIARMFIAGLLPALLVSAMLMALIYVMARFELVQCPPPRPFSGRHLLRSAKGAFFALLTPVVILRGITAGWATPSEAGILAVIYALALGLVQRRVTWASLIEVMRKSIESTALIMFIIAISTALSFVLVSEGTAAEIGELITGFSKNPLVFLLIANALLMVMGAVIETLPAMLISVPVLLPTANALGVDPVHFGVVVIFNLIVGIMTPPIGIGLYILMAISEVSFGKLVLATIPFHLVLLVALAIMILFPELSLYLPRLILG